MTEVDDRDVGAVRDDRAGRLAHAGTRQGDAQPADEVEGGELEEEGASRDRHSPPFDPLAKLGGQGRGHHAEINLRSTAANRLEERALHAAAILDIVGDQHDSLPASLSGVVLEGHPDEVQPLFAASVSLSITAA